MANVIIPPWHQSAPTLKHDPVLAEEAARQKSPAKASRKDWDAINWEAINPNLARRRAMVNQDFDAEFDQRAYHDRDLMMLEQIAWRQQLELRPEQWVEESLELFERNREKAKEQHLPGQERWGEEYEPQRLVNIMHPNEVMRRLRAAGVDARTEAHPNARIWLNDWTAGGLVGVNAWAAPQEMDDEGYLVALQYATSQAQKDLITENFHACRAGRKVQRTFTSLQEPYGPEWSIMRFDERGVAHKEKYRGWRTAMLVLIVAGVLTEEEVDRAFGPPLGEAGAFYRAQLKIVRQIGIER